LTGCNLRSLAVCIVFAVHTVNTEAVNSISYREDIFVALFCVLSLLFYIRYTQHSSASGKNYILSLVFFFFGVFSKEMALSLPVLIVLYDWFFIADFKLRNLIRRIKPVYCGYGLVAIFYLLIRFYFFRELEETRIPYPGDSFFVNVLTMATVFVYYIKLMWIPTGLTCHYLYGFKKSLLEPQVILAFAVLAGLAIFAFYTARRKPLISFMIAAFFASLLPVANIFPIVNIVAERYLYFPLVFFSIFFVFFLEWIVGIVFCRVPLSKLHDTVFLIILLVFISAFSVLSYQRNYQWFDNFTLWQSAARVQPWSAKAHNNLGLSYKSLGLSPKAIEEYEEAMRVNPQYTDAGNNLAILYGELGDHDLEIKTYLRCLAINPGDATMNYNTGMAHMEQGKIQEGLRFVQKAVALNPRYVNAHNGLAIIYLRIGRFVEAKKHWEIALSIDPDHPSANANYRRLLKHLKTP